MDLIFRFGVRDSTLKKRFHSFQVFLPHLLNLNFYIMCLVKYLAGMGHRWAVFESCIWPLFCFSELCFQVDSRMPLCDQFKPVLMTLPSTDSSNECKLLTTLFPNFNVFLLEFSFARSFPLRCVDKRVWVSIYNPIW